MSQALATITPESSFIPLMAVQQRPHGQGYTMPAKQLETAADVLAASRAAYHRLRASRAPVKPPASAQERASNASVATVPHERDFLFIRTKFAGEHIARTGGVWQKAAELLILAETAMEHGVTVAQIEGPTRRRNVVAARFEVYYRMSKELGYSLPMIGKAVGDRDHTGIMHGIRRHEAALQGVFYRRTRPRGLSQVAAG